MKKSRKGVKQVEELEIYLYDDIEANGKDWEGNTIVSDTSADTVRKKLADANPDAPIAFHINSYGGDVKEGVAIYTLIKQHNGPVTVYVDGFACSIASLIAMGGNKIIMGKLAMMMTHGPWTVVAGNAEELRKEAEILDKITETMSIAYRERCGDKLTDERLKAMMTEDTWLNAEECVALGLADEIAGESPGDKLAQAKSRAATLMKKKTPDAPNAEAKNNAERLMLAFKKMEDAV